MLAETGLGYLTLGQASNTLSGGEAQRLKLVTELIKGRRVSRNALMKGKELPGDLYSLRNPPSACIRGTCVFFIDAARLADQGNTVIVIEHNTEIMAEADYIIDMGPDRRGRRPHRSQRNPGANRSKGFAHSGIHTPELVESK